MWDFEWTLGINQGFSQIVVFYMTKHQPCVDLQGTDHSLRQSHIQQ